MTGLVRKATLLSVGGLLIAGAAMAGLPDADFCTMGGQSVDGARMVIYDGAQNLAAIQAGQLIVIRDAENNVVPDAEVSFVITDHASANGANGGVGIMAHCPAGAVELCTFQEAPWIGAGPDPNGPGRRINFRANGAGQLFITALGNGANFNCGLGVPSSSCASDDPAAPSRPICVNVYAGGNIFLGAVIVTNATYNLNTVGGNTLVNAADGSQWLDVRLAHLNGANSGTQPGGYNTKGDYNGDGVINAGDGSIIQAAIAAAMTVPTCIAIAP